MSITFRFVPPTDESVDGQYDLFDNGTATQIYIQDCRAYGGNYVISECGNEGTQDSYWTREFAETPSLKNAKLIAMAYYRNIQTSTPPVCQSCGG